VYQVELGEGDEIDHESGDRSNNKSWNLRLVGNVQNSRNKGTFSNNSSGVTGVGFHTNKAGNLYCKAQWNDLKGKRKSKYFSVASLGLLPAFKQACVYRDAIISELNTQGAGYTERHGT
jgi:hypothetical protein